jgi:excinuclease ABC subunit C
MRAAAASEEFELAAKYRDDLGALTRVLEKQTVVLPDGTDADVLGFEAGELEVAVQIFSVRGGRIRGQRGWVADAVAGEDLGEYVQRALITLYADATPEAIPPLVLVPALPTDADAVRELLEEHRGARVAFRVPRRGAKRRLMATVEQNAKQAMLRHALSRASDLTARSAALEELRDALGLANAPLRIECYDISNLQGTEIVASMVVFEDGLPRKSEYRRFTIRQPGQSDVAAMHQVITRRLRRLLEAQEEPEDPLAKKFSYRPSLIVVDGGPTQVAAARKAMDELGVTDISLCGLAKRLEEIWLPDAPEPVTLPRTSEALYLMQRVRDEAHRFANTHHRERRGRAMTASALDGIPGLGPTRKKALLKHFGSVTKLRLADAEAIGKVPGIGPTTAESIVARLAAASVPVGVNTTTGEVLE